MKSSVKFRVSLAILFAMLCSSGSLFAQSIVCGIVRKENAKPAKGCKVYVKDRPKVKTKVSKTGFWALDGLMPEDVLVFSLKGYVEISTTVGDFKELDVNLLPVSVNADWEDVDDQDAVNVGYGVLRRQEVSSAVSTIKAKEFDRGAVNNPLELLIGKVPGLTIEGNTIQLRGAQSFYGSTAPLIVIDGMRGASLDGMSVQEIDTISVLRDAASCAMYGTEGANGVILITTKKD